MLTIFLRAVILYAVSVLGIRLMGKRQIGQLQPYELVAAILIADLAAGPMAGAETPLLYGIIPIAALVLLHSAVSLIGMKSPAFRKLLNGSARVLVKNGDIQYDELKRVCLTVSDLMEDIRANGVMSISEVGTAVLETNGALSVYPLAKFRPVATGDMRLNVPEDTLPVVLISDGQYRFDALKSAGLTREKLDQTLRANGLGEGRRVLLCCLDGAGVLFVQAAEDGARAKRICLPGKASAQEASP